MRDLLGPGTILGYCTNVHAGPTLEGTCANLDRHAVAVKAIVSPDAPMGVGLWLAAEAAAELRGDDGVDRLRGFLDDRGLLPFTLNGFPYGDFHQRRVKHAVYRPDWTDERRAAYTTTLADILAGLLDDGAEGSISTLPLGWGKHWSADHGERAADLIADVIEHLARLESRTGRLIHLDLEPEPGCVLERSADVARFFTDHVTTRLDHDRASRHLRVCHDVCHAAVMDDEQERGLRRYAEAGLTVGKVQVSSAVQVELRGLDAEERRVRLEQLRRFVEERYLHQTTARGASGWRFHEDLPPALAAAAADGSVEELRVHFHVPIDLESIGSLGTTRGWITEGVPLLRSAGARHWEVETYAWDVLPAPLRTATLAEGIARELDWIAKRCGVGGGVEP